MSEFLRTFIESREWFIWEATESVSWWDERDERALVLGSANPHVSEPTLSVVFRCSKQLDPRTPPVTDWIEECLAAARGALPEVYAELQSVSYLCTRASEHIKADRTQGPIEPPRKFGYQFSAVSGAGIDALYGIGHRFDADLDGYRPGNGDSWVIEARGGSAVLHIGGFRWLTGLWRSLEGRVFVTDVAGTVSMLLDPAGTSWQVEDLRAGLAGVYGVSESDVWCWGLRGETCVTFRYDGARWSEHPCPIHVTRMDARGGALVAVGYKGGIAHWEGGRWVQMGSPTRAGLVDVCVLSPDLVYALSANDEVLEGSVHGFAIHARAPQSVNAIASFHDEVVLGGLAGIGVSKLGGDPLRPIQPQLDVLSFDARRDLLVCCLRSIHASPDLETWTGFTVDLLESLTAHEPAEWRRSSP